MTYLEVLPLAEIKNYLHLEDDFLEDDLKLERMITSAFQFIEATTNHIIESRTNVVLSNPCGTIITFDYPIQYTGDVVRFDYAGKTVFYSTTVTVNVGYEDASKIPSPLITASMQMIEYFYYDNEKQVNTAIIPQSIMQLIYPFKRFIVC